MYELQKQVDEWIRQYGVRYFNEMTNTVLLMEEVGELSRYMARVYGEQSFKHTEDEREARTRIREEMADILFVMICLANQMDIRLDEALADSIRKKTGRDQDRHHSNPKLKPPQ
ncbi:MAG TPA: nucleotide pyrophosphohydrolase [Saprospiraceae bacterium]|nr:nucleotide pyrophosphohydrolase [Saprospiraceae bacterium]